MVKSAPTQWLSNMSPQNERTGMVQTSESIIYMLANELEHITMKLSFLTVYSFVILDYMLKCAKWNISYRFRAPTMPSRRYVEVNAAMLATKRSAGVAPEVNFGEHVTYTPPPSVNKAASSRFETQKRDDVTRSPKQGYPWPQKTDLFTPKQ